MSINSTRILTLWKNILISQKPHIWDLFSPQNTRIIVLIMAMLMGSLGLFSH